MYRFSSEKISLIFLWNTNPSVLDHSNKFAYLMTDEFIFFNKVRLTYRFDFSHAPSFFFEENADSNCAILVIVLNCIADKLKHDLIVNIPVSI
jgi:hypothetical protein